MQDELNRAKQEMLRSCPSAAHVILGELKRLQEQPVRCSECTHFDSLQEETGVCWKIGWIKRKDGYCDEGERRTVENARPYREENVDNG